MSQSAEKPLRGFAAMSPERQREIASLGGQSVRPERRSFSQNRDLAQSAGTAGGKISGGNFKNSRERAVEAGRKGGSASGGNFRNNPERAAICGPTKRT